MRESDRLSTALEKIRVRNEASRRQASLAPSRSPSMSCDLCIVPKTFRCDLPIAEDSDSPMRAKLPFHPRAWLDSWLTYPRFLGSLKPELLQNGADELGPRLNAQFRAIWPKKLE